MTARTYDFKSIESKWQAVWQQRNTFRALDPGDPGFDGSKKKFYVLDMFPYPSGAGLHVGHPLGYIATDIVARYRRMQGYNVLHPMGFDAFGLPAEQYAIEHGVHPREATATNIANMRRQLKALGLSYDWDRELSTTEVDYYRWTQWIFLQLYNSYVDPRDQKAHPVAELEQRLRSGELGLDAEGQPVAAAEAATRFAELAERDQRAAIDGQRLAYLAEVAVNWCPALGTVLANEEVTDEGRSERGNHPVFRRPLKQWMLRITSYAERLLADLATVDWPESVRALQTNWIGRSEGALCDFEVVGGQDKIRVYTTRPDTLFGATYMVLAPEHPLVKVLTTAEQKTDVEAYCLAASRRSEVDRQAETKSKTGVFSGAYAINPVNAERIPVWIADYVLMGYGTGAIMAVPAHDQRDFEFAKQFELPVRVVVEPTKAWLEEQFAGQTDGRTRYLADPKQLDQAFAGQGCAVNSANPEVSLDGLETSEAKRTITAWLAEKGLGRAKVNYKLRDWLFSRQRYWGEPFPILHHAAGYTLGVSDQDLPVLLPEMSDFSPTTTDNPEPTLSRAAESWREVTVDGVVYQRELNTMPQWAGSCWYYLRFIDPKNRERFVDRQKERYWMGANGIDLYVGGVEHANLHLLYARFWHKVLYDLGHVSTAEPFGRLFNQGYILADYYEDARGVRVPADEVQYDSAGGELIAAYEVSKAEPGGKFLYQGQEVFRKSGKMGKSLKNVVNPDDLYQSHGCDTLRLYEMYMGPVETSKPWNTRDIVGVHRFLLRVWRNFFDIDSGELLVSDEAPSDELTRALHKTIKRVTDDMDRMRFNTAIAALIELNNQLVSVDRVPRSVADAFVLMLAPIAPHICEELWQALGHNQSLACEPWPSYDEALLADAMINIVVQIKGKTRGNVSVPAEATEEEIRQIALADEKINKHVEGKTIRKVIYVPGRLINIVAT
ncbi:MAG: leucine--tRNA ligase [Deltaproteobacteria bacterium]|nr:leucine--tRNA ligase [Deltaproteobacteria bacterium]